MWSASVAVAAIALSALPTTLGHGFITKVTIGSKVYKGIEPWGSGTNSIVRKIQNTNPNHINDGANLACGRGAAKSGASQVATIKAGDKITWTWDGGDFKGSPWPHDSGPLITYAAACPGTTCVGVDASKLDWFKIAQVGKTKTPGNTWVQAQLVKGKDYSMTLPTNFPNGNFIIRHEIIALHLADNLNGAEFYPSCMQVKVTGGSSAKAGSPTVKFPGGYKASDSGIHINIWDKTGAYPFPGPKIASFSGSPAANPVVAAVEPSDEPAEGTADPADEATDPADGAANEDNADETDDSSNNSDDGYGKPSEGDDSNSNSNNDEDCDEDDGKSEDDTASETDPAPEADPASDVKTVTVTVTVTAGAEETGKTSKDKAKNKEARSKSLRRSRAHYAPRRQSS